MGKEKGLGLPAPEMDDLTEEQEAKIVAFRTAVWEPMRAARLAFESTRGGAVASSESSGAAAAADADADDVAPETLSTPAFDQMLLPHQAKLTEEADVRIGCYKFLVARQWDAEKAEEMLRETCRFKYERKLVDTPIFPLALPVRGFDLDAVRAFDGFSAADERPTTQQCDLVYKHLLPFYQCTYHKWDKWGHPLFIEATGNISVVGLVEKLKQLKAPDETPDVPMNAFHIHFNEAGDRLVRYMDATYGPTVNRRVQGVVAVLDCNALGMGHLYKPALDVLKQVWAVDSAHYPEGLHGLWVVNAPGMINFAYNIVKGWLDPRVRAKVRIVKPDKTTETLLEFIDAENLPKFLGGECECEGGCVYGRDGGVPPPEDDPTLLSELFNVGSGKKDTRDICADAGDSIVWEFVVGDGRNVEFSARFFADGDDEDDEGREVFMTQKQQTQSAQHVCAEKGKLVLTFSNEYSWVRSKDITLRLFVTPAS